MTYVQKKFLTEINCNVYKYKHSSEIRGFRLDVNDLEKTLAMKTYSIFFFIFDCLL